MIKSRGDTSKTYLRTWLDLGNTILYLILLCLIFHRGLGAKKKQQNTLLDEITTFSGIDAVVNRLQSALDVEWEGRIHLSGASSPQPSSSQRLDMNKV